METLILLINLIAHTAHFLMDMGIAALLVFVLFGKASITVKFFGKEYTL